MMNLADLAERLRERLKSPLPGASAHQIMYPGFRGEKPGGVPDDARVAAVLELLYPLPDGRLGLLFFRRTSHDPRDAHAGQIGFPGGSVEEEDKTLADTALREAWEEVAVPPASVDLLGQLSPLYIPVSNFLVHPFLGVAAVRPDFKGQDAEVDEILELPLEDFLRPDARATKSMTMSSGFRLPKVPYWDVQGETIWGATSMLVAELVSIIQEIE
ncbi:MAG: CoA pyrophosphatase [Bacteroidota bacterium]